MLPADFHVHTISSGHAFNTIHEYAREAKRKGMRTIAITDHGPNVARAPGIEYFKVGYRVPKTINGVRVLFGVEANILDTKGTIDIDKHLAEKLDVVIASIHTSSYGRHSEMDNTMAMCASMKNASVRIIGHPVNAHHPIDVDTVAHAACEHGTLLELNNSTFRYAHKQAPGYAEAIKRMVRIVQEHGHQLIINSDAHVLEELGVESDVMNMQPELGFRRKDIINYYPAKLKKVFKI
jgi:putative hydrolase